MKKTTPYLIAIFYIVLAITLIAGILLFFEKRDVELMAWAEVYEICVEAEYGVTPTQFYNSNGHYPECDTSKYEKKMEL